MASTAPWNNDIGSTRGNLREFLINGNNGEEVMTSPTVIATTIDDEKTVAEQPARNALFDQLSKLHPALSMMRDLEPTLNTAIRRNPLAALAIGVIAGGALVYAKPWRRVDVRTLAKAAAGTTSTTALASAALAAFNQYAKKN